MKPEIVSIYFLGDPYFGGVPYLASLVLCNFVLCVFLAIPALAIGASSLRNVDL